MRSQLLIVLLLLFVTSFSNAQIAIPENVWESAERIYLPGGPEDFAVVENAAEPYILISCANRRNDPLQSNQIVKYSWRNNEVLILPRKGEPDELTLKPHGVFYLHKGEEQYLYVISHDDQFHYHPVVRYRIYADYLAYDTSFYDRNFISPNDLHVMSDGSFYFVNDAGVRGKKSEIYLQLRRGSVIYHDGKSGSKPVADHIGMPAGIFVNDTSVFVSAATENNILYYPIQDGGELGKKRVLMKLKSPDNMFSYQDQIIVAGHSNKLKFIRHVKNSAVISPWYLCAFSYERTCSLLLSGGGDRISGVSAGTLVNNKYLILTQIFEPFFYRININKED